MQKLKDKKRERYRLQKGRTTRKVYSKDII